VIRPLGVVLAATAALAAGCTSAEQSAVTKKQPVRTEHIRKVLVTVVDGDTRRRIRGAIVRIGPHAARSDTQGVAAVPLRRHVSLPVYVGRSGYAKTTVRLAFARRPQATVRIYRPELQWPLYGASPARTQTQDAIHVRPPFRIVWSRGLGSLIEFPAVVANGVAYIANYHGTVRAISMRTGKVAWRHDIPAGKMAASPAVAGDEVVVHGMDGHVWVFERRNGRLLWRFTVGSPVESSPVVLDGVDYFGSWNGRVYALDLRTHRLRWTRNLGYKITSSAALAGNRVYIGDYGGRIFALARGTGRAVWVGSVNGRIYGTPAVAGGRVFVPSSDGNSMSAFSTSGRLLWRVNAGAYVYSSPAVWRGRVFFGSYNGVFYCVSASTGRVLWEVGAGGSVSGAAVVVDGVAYVGSFGHEITGVEASSGRVLLRFPHGEYVPVSGNGGTLLLHGFSRIFAVQHR
jgi:outer membrane protein assembly factor BamB